MLRQAFDQQDFSFADRLMFRMQADAKLVKVFPNLQGMDHEVGVHQAAADHGKAVGLIVARRSGFSRFGYRTGRVLSVRLIGGDSRGGGHRDKGSFRAEFRLGGVRAGASTDESG